MYPFWKQLQLNSTPPSSSITTKQYSCNKISNIPMSMPFKPETMTQGSDLSNARSIYRKIFNDKEILYVGNNAKSGHWYSGSDVTRMRKLSAIGKNANTTKPWIMNNVMQSPALSNAFLDRNTKNSRLRIARSGGYIAPSKKSAII